MIYAGENDIIEEVVIDTGNSDQYHVKWYNVFVGSVSIDASGRFLRTKVWPNHYSKMEFLTPLYLFKNISPTTY